MNNMSASDVLSGHWIWYDRFPSAAQQHVLFRRDFLLDSPPGTCELQFASLCPCQIFINGHFFASGPIPHPLNSHAYISRMDISHLMTIGVNSVAVHACRSAVNATSRPADGGGLWLQLIGDNGETLIATDGTWLVCPVDAYADTDLKASPADPGIEILDYARFPNDWLTIVQNAQDDRQSTTPGAIQWQFPTSVISLDDAMTPLDPLPFAPPVFEPMVPQSILFRGIVKQKNDILWVSFADIRKQRRQPGLYAAETYVNLPSAAQHSLFCFSGSPFRLFINGELAAEQDVPEQQHRHALPPCMPPQASCSENSMTETVCTFRQGWNRITVAKWCDAPESGFALLFGDSQAGNLLPFRTPSEDAMPGWSVSGPLRTPLQMLTGHFSLEQLPRIPFSTPGDLYRDAVAFSLASEYYGDPDERPPFHFPVSLAQDQTVVLDFGKTVYAVPELKISSCNLGDILDVTLGEHLFAAEVIAYENGTRRNISTIRLSDVPDGAPPVNWVINGCKGFRYAMLTARRARTVITIQNIIAFVSVVEPPARGSFICSDNTLNAIWNTGVATLDVTLQGYFMDAPAKDHTQCLPDSMIQSFSAFYTHDGYAVSAAALAAFARSQTETGEFNSLVPSSFMQAIPDFSLLWPVWLQKHLLVTGDKALLQKLLPAMNALLDHYSALAEHPDAPLPQLDTVIGNHPFLDLGEIDRQGISTGLNAIYCRALFSAAWIAAFAGLPELETTYRNRAQHIAQHVRSLNWNPSAMLFADSSTAHGQSVRTSWQSNVLAIYGGIARQEDFLPIWNQLFTDTPPYITAADGNTANPYFNAFVLETAFSNGHARWAMMFMRYYWGKMLEAGATSWWELFDPADRSKDGRLCSHCQGYAVSPNQFLITEAAGIIPAEPGMSTVFFQPNTDELSWCRVSIPAPQGHINAEWELLPDGTLTITIQANFPLNVIPRLSPKHASNATFQISNSVSVLVEDTE